MDETKQRSILAVDDEIHMLKLLERIIAEKTSYRIVTTSNALEVPGLLDQDKFDLIISDLKMPGLNGINMMKMLTERGRGEQLIIITAFGSIESSGEAFELGVFDYITKPFRKEQIITAVDRAMRFQSVKREADCFARLINSEPFSSALDMFKAEYVRKLRLRCGADEEQMMERSGISTDEIKSFLKATGR